MSGGSQARVPVVRGESLGQPHVRELLDGSWRQTVATGLFPRKLFLFKDCDLVILLRQPVSDGRTCRSATNYEDVGGFVIVQRAQPMEGLGAVPTSPGAFSNIEKSSAIEANDEEPLSSAR